MDFMAAVLIVQNTSIENSGHLGKLLDDDGFEITTVNAKHEQLPDENFSLVVILGASESANDDLPYLHAEQKMIKRCVEDDIPVLGICLGSQLLAKTFGSKVYAVPKKEIGFYDDLRISGNSELFSNFNNPFTVFHWHGDTFDLPAGATRLASSGDYLNQAFRYHSAVGLQFHLEVDEVMVNRWVDNAEEELLKIPHVDPEKIRSDIAKNIPTVKLNMSNFYDNFKSFFGI